MRRQHGDSHGDDEVIGKLLQHVGARGEPSAEIKNEVQQAVHAQWHAMLLARSRRRRTFTYGLASVAALVMIAVGTFQWLAPDRAMVATIARIDGSLQLAAAGAAPAAARVGQHLSAGETLKTDAGTRVALAFGADVSVRIDAGSTVEFDTSDRLVLHAGAVYVDARPGRPLNGALEVQTRAGVLRHLGTQYQARQDGRAVVISVREGRVEVEGLHGVNRASAGEVLHIASGSIVRTTISPNDASWQWAIAAAPAFDIDNRSLSDFLDWVARETGKRIVYASPQALQSARDVVLRGSIGGLDPESALVPVLSTTNLRRFATADGSIGIELAASPGSNPDAN